MAITHYVVRMCWRAGVLAAAGHGRQEEFEHWYDERHLDDVDADDHEAVAARSSVTAGTAAIPLSHDGLVRPLVGKVSEATG